MNEDLRKTFETSTLIVHSGKYVYAKVKTAPQINNHFLITKDADEITVITKQDYIEELNLIEKNNEERSLLEIRFAPDSSDVAGFLAAISSGLAAGGISISVVSTYSKDYLLVSTQDLKRAIHLLKKLGFSSK